MLSRTHFGVEPKILKIIFGFLVFGTHVAIYISVRRRKNREGKTWNN